MFTVQSQSLNTDCRQSVAKCGSTSFDPNAWKCRVYMRQGRLQKRLAFGRTPTTIITYVAAILQRFLVLLSAGRLRANYVQFIRRG